MLRGKGISQIDENDFDIFLSIREHLQALLNTKRGTLNHLPDYGLSFIPDHFVGSNPKEADAVMAIVKNEMYETIRKYEPRIVQLVITMKPPPKGTFRLEGNIKAVVDTPDGMEEMSLETQISNVGIVELKL